MSLKPTKPILPNEIHPTIDANYYKGLSNQRRLICTNDSIGGGVVEIINILGTPI